MSAETGVQGDVRRRSDIRFWSIAGVIALCAMLYDYYLDAASLDPEYSWGYSGAVKREALPLDQNGIIYTGGSDGYVSALYSNGEPLWRCPLGSTLRSGIEVSPEGLIYVHDRAGWLHCISGGTKRWSYELGDATARAGLLSVEGRVYVLSQNQGLFAVSSEGGLLWRFGAGPNASRTPAVDRQGNVYVLRLPFGSANGTLHCLAPDGSERWQNAYSGPALSGLFTDPHGNVCISDGNSLVAINPDGSELRRTPVALQFVEPLLFADGSLCFMRSDSLVKVDASGKELWSTRIAGSGLRMFNAGKAPAAGSDGRIYLGIGYLDAPNLLEVLGSQLGISAAPLEPPGKLLAFSSAGRRLWSYDYEYSLEATPSVLPDGAVCVAAANDTVIAVKP